ncbi:transposase [Rubrivirga sp. S365]|uniref:IS110 family transposase n=1 Tax=Rubrivirga sp. S365 TaxID=3076080 RepID=UPI0028C9DCCA|nr:transposase [Rubrivirga sp. S365]MDT7855625.1 transposase [Rubrivirga sp. S365]MDT7857805.1 transposase [Rubrivirga sp. S365]
MKIRSIPAPDKARPVLLLAADVSRDTLHLFSRFESGHHEVVAEDVIPNRTEAVERALAEAATLAAEHGLRGVRVLCEASGGYERALLAVARRAGHQTALISAEQVGQLTKAESLDTGKTDRKDARVIHLAAAMGRTQRHRDLPEPYVVLRHLTAFHDDEVRVTSAIRTRLQATLRDLFPDYDRSAQFTFSKTGRALLHGRLLCPHRLAQLGRTRLLATLRRRVPGVKTATGERLVTAAEASVRSAPPPAVAAVLSGRLAALVAELEVHEGQAEALKERIEALGAELKARDQLPPIDEAVSGITLFNLARIVGQTGPLSDFATKRQLLRYAGMNLRERESGQYKGQTRLSKKGRPMLRKVLGQAVFPVLRGDRLLGARYAERRERMVEQKARVAAMRKLLTVVWGAHRSREPFDPARVHVCQSEYALAA